MNAPSSALDSAEPAAVLDLEERRWLPRYCDGDQQAFEELVRSYGKLIYTFLCRYGVAPQNRDDLFQEVFLKVHRAAASYRSSEPLRPWLISIVLNTVRNARRAGGRREHLLWQVRSEAGLAPELDTIASAVAPSAAGLDEHVDRQRTLQWLGHRITELGSPQREVLVLSTLQGLSMKEIAKILELPENTVKTHLRRARLALAESLAKRNAAAGGGA